MLVEYKTLKRCPFCGSEAEYQFRIFGKSAERERYICWSRKCGMSGKWHKTKEEAKEAWNKRQPEN